MGELIGYVSRALGAPFQALTGVSAGGTAPISKNQFTATRKNGDIIGTFAGAREAQLALENSSGADVLNWRQEPNTSENAIERWEGRSTYFYPGDFGERIFGGGWWRGDQGVRLRPTGPQPSDFTVSLWASFDGSRVIRATPPTIAAQPLFFESGLGGRDGLRFAVGSIDLAATNLTLAAPYSVFAVATYQPAGREQAIIRNSVGVGLGVAAGGDWFVDASGGRLLGDVALPNESVVIGATVNAGGVLEGFFNFGSLGTIAQGVGAGLWTISDAVNGWAEDIYEIVIVRDALNDTDLGRLKTYFERRYQRTFS